MSSRVDLRICLDFTSLNDTDTPQTIAAFCDLGLGKYPQMAALCVYPAFVAQVAARVQGLKVRVATVVNFPTGDEALETVVTQIQASNAAGADEIDLVFPYKRFLKGESVERFLKSCRSACEGVCLKIILETGVLIEPLRIREAAELALQAGADFLKTSTGKAGGGATLEAAQVMLEVIKAAGSGAGIKLSGGIRSAEQAQAYAHLAKQVMGENWLTPNTFRIGASQPIF